jgi:alkylation response protein AidB-like acyl-CoA dehydrogenase
VSNGTIASVAALFCTIDPAEGFKGGGVCLVPLDLPGVSRGKPLDKLGQRALNQGEIFFDDVRIPVDYMVFGKEAYATVVETVLTMANAAMGTIFVGVARAALEHAIEYALARRVLLYNSTSPPLVQYSIASKVFCTNTAFEVASGALQTFGGNGLSREYPVEKLLRDARASMIEDGCNEVLSLVGASKL